VRDIGGDLSGDVELVSVEVKAGNEPFATATGQALGYRIYAHRVYLADRREKTFTHDEIQIASHLGVGLLRISPDSGRVNEEMSSPHHHPILSMSLRMLEQIGLLPCALCRTFFRSGNTSSTKFTAVTRENLKLALRQQRGLMFWNRESAERKHKKKIRISDDGKTYERRFICRDCVEYVVKPIAFHNPK